MGAPAAEAMGLDDPIIDVAVTPNRGDCLGVRGIALDLAAAGLGSLKPLDTTPVVGRFESPIGVRLEFAPDAASACPYFAGRLIRGVRNAESPPWLQNRLVAAGLRPISALVDITNYRRSTSAGRCMSSTRTSSRATSIYGWPAPASGSRL